MTIVIAFVDEFAGMRGRKAHFRILFLNDQVDLIKRIEVRPASWGSAAGIGDPKSTGECRIDCEFGMSCRPPCI